MDTKATLAIDREHFVEELRTIPSGPHRVRDSRLRKLAYKYRHLKECREDIPFDLRKFGYPQRMSFDDFIWEVIG